MDLSQEIISDRLVFLKCLGQGEFKRRELESQVQKACVEKFCCKGSREEQQIAGEVGSERGNVCVSSKVEDLVENDNATMREDRRWHLENPCTQAAEKTEDAARQEGVVVGVKEILFTLL